MYPSDLTDAEWKRIAHHFRPKDRRGSGCNHEKKRIVDAILYVVRGDPMAYAAQKFSSRSVRAGRARAQSSA